MADWRAELQDACAFLHGRLHGEEVAQQSSLEQSLHSALRQEDDGLLHTPVVGFMAAVEQIELLWDCCCCFCCVRKLNVISRMSAFVLSGIWLLLQEFSAHERLELLNAAVDVCSTHLLHYWLPQLEREKINICSLY